MHEINYLATTYMNCRTNDATYGQLFFAIRQNYISFPFYFRQFFCTVEICCEIIPIQNRTKNFDVCSNIEVTLVQEISPY